MWYEELGYQSPVDYYFDEFRFPAAKDLKHRALVRVALASMMDEEGIPRVNDTRCCRSCGRMVISDITCEICGMPV